MATLELDERLKEERSSVEDCLPAYMLHMCLESIDRNSPHITVRPDFMEGLNRSSIIPLKDYNEFTRERLARIVMKDGYAILKDAGDADDLQTMTRGAALFILDLVNAGKITDETKMAVLISLELMEEIKDIPESWGNPKRAIKMANKMMSKANSLGYFT